MLFKSLRSLKKFTQINWSRTMASTKNKFALPSRLIESERDIWMEYDELTLKYNPINMLGFPDYVPCKHIVDTLADVSVNNQAIHQYTRGFGHPRLITVLSKLYSKLLQRDINAQKEMLVTYGAMEGLYCVILGHLDKGDEIIIVEPYFNNYLPMVYQAGGIPRFVTLKPTDKNTSSADWKLDPKELEAAFNSKTKLFLLNNPHNPLGKVYTLDELQLIADLCKKYNVLCLSDEVYEWLAFTPNKHIRMATLPGMWERTLTVGSAGKTFGVTGWKTGWVYGPSNIMFNLQMVHQNCLYTLSTILQEALAITFENELAQLDSHDCIFNSMRVEIEKKRDYLVKVLNEIGMKPVVPDGGIFVQADWSLLEKKIQFDDEKDKEKDCRFAKWLIKQHGIQVVPCSTFYTDKNKSNGENYVRFAFIKKDETLKAAADILKKLG